MTVAVFGEGAVRDRAALSGVRGWMERRRADRLDELQAARLVQAWVATCYGAGLGADTSSAAGIGGVQVPQVVSVNLGEPIRLMVRLRAGQLVSDLVKVADRLAVGLSVPRVRITPRAHGYARVELLRAEPLAAIVDFPGPIRSVYEPVLLGRDEHGPDLRLSLVESGHIVEQGMTRLGKSMWAYSLLGQLVEAPDVEVAGCDPQGMLLRPWAAREGAQIALGLADVEQHVDVLEGLVSEMDRRLQELPRGVDKLQVSQTDRLIVVVIEELPALIRAARGYPTPAKVDGVQPAKVVDRIQRAVGRLLAESHKVGFRVLSIAQRQDAELYGSGGPRGQFGVRISFACDSDALKMLHDVPADLVAAHATALPGIALISGVGLPLARVRGPYMAGEYAAYCELVAGRQ